MKHKKTLERRLNFEEPMTKGILPIVKTAKVDKNNYSAKSNNNNHYKQTPIRNYKQKL